VKALRRSVGVALTLAFAVSACSGSSGTNAPTATPDPGANAALTDLAALAGKAAAASFGATYSLVDSNDQRLGVVSVARTPAALRFDFAVALNGKPTHTTIWKVKRGTFACAARPHRSRLCLVLAHGSSSAPGVFADYLPLEQVFTGDLTALARPNPDNVTVASLPDEPATPKVPMAHCFTVATSPPSTVDSGTYCFAANGIPTKMVFTTGSSLTMRTVNTRAPTPRLLVPPKHPIPLPRPSTTPPPTPTPTVTAV
jgi:hypothetical protein